MQSTSSLYLLSSCTPILLVRHYIQDCHVQKVTVHAGVLLSDATALSSPNWPDVLGERVLRMLIPCPECHRIPLTRSVFMFETIEDTPSIIRTRYITTGQGHTPLSHGQQVFEILSRSNMAVRSHGPDTDFGYECTVTLTLEVWPWVKVMTHPWVMGKNYVKYYPDPTWQWRYKAGSRIFGICALWPWPWKYDLGSRSWHTLGSWTTIVWNIIQIKHGSEEFWPDHGFWVCVRFDLEFGDMTLG